MPALPWGVIRPSQVVMTQQPSAERRLVLSFPLQIVIIPVPS